MALTTAPRHLITAAQLDRRTCDELLEQACGLVEQRDQVLQGLIMACLFHEPSTRTRLSFESAMLRRGGQVLGTEAGATSSSSVKGETLQDTIRVVSGYADVIVLRHPQTGSAAEAAAVADVPIINAGDGSGEHPTQALTDLLTLRLEYGRVDGLRIAVCGDLRHGRTVHSLVRLLSLYRDIELTLVAPAPLQLDEEVATDLEARGVRISCVAHLEELPQDIDVVYQTRLQRERLAADDMSDHGLRITPEFLRGRRTLVLHPLPRVGEVDPAIDADPRAGYFRQAHNGVWLRMALLEWLLQ